MRPCLRETKTVGNLVTTWDLFEEVEQQKELKRNSDNEQAISQPLTKLDVKKSFNVYYEELLIDVTLSKAFLATPSHT